ncbi:MAG: CPBP family intramembrane metalloprotease [Gemmatimonadota bacterium]|nr:MAG: CPBP family intramembrane metalloprotease [Gemmatimonadota bacterium]
MNEIDQVIAPLFARSPFIDLIVVAVLAGLGEELLFRGVIQPFLSGFAGTALALLMTSLLFGLLHLVTPTYALIAAIFGLYLGGLMISTGEILVPITAHALYDMVALGLLRERGRRGHLKDQSLGREGDGNDSTDTPQ